MIDESRIQHLNRNREKSGEFVIYWMQQSQRAECNHALEFAIERANALKIGLVVYFGLTDAFPEANERHYHFMLEGLREVKEALGRRGVCMVVEQSTPEVGVLNLSRSASLVVCDRGYLRIQRAWREFVARRIECSLIQIEGDAVVPIEIASNKEEYSAATLRPKLHRLLGRYLVDLEERSPDIDTSRWKFDGADVSDPSRVVAGLAVDRSVVASSYYHGGTAEANRRLNEFISDKLDRYEDLRNDPNEDSLSNLSPYLHFGQISPVRVAAEISRRHGNGSGAFLEELIVRRELGINFVHHNYGYDAFAGLPNWARQTLLKHQQDDKEYTYTREELEQARTHDPYWNAAQMEMVLTGKMHGYMRMYWGKKILEWTARPEDAYLLALNLNNKYEIDGRDPNGFAGVAWCFGKHDRPWGERRTFGNVRYMNASGLKRKFDADRYASRFGS